MDELWLERMAEVLCCDKDPAAVVVAVKDLQDQLASAKRMIAHLRSEGRLHRSPIESDFDAMLFARPMSEDRIGSGVILNPEDKFLSIDGVGQVEIPKGSGVLNVKSSLGISGTLDIKYSAQLGLRKLVGYKFIQKIETQKAKNQ